MATGEQGQTGSLVNISTVFTYTRLLILPVAIAAVTLGDYRLAAAAVGAAVLTDLADGGAATVLRQRSQFGKELDSTVDFVFIHCMFITLYATRHMPTYQFAVIYAAMLGTLTLQLVTGARGGSGVVRTTFGKTVGALEYAYLVLLVGGMALPRYASVVPSTWLFGVLAAAIAVYLPECIVRIVRKGQPNVD